MTFTDHGIFRMSYKNQYPLHKVAPDGIIVVIIRWDIHVRISRCHGLSGLMVGPTRRYPVPLAAAEREDVTINRELFCIGLSLSAGRCCDSDSAARREWEREREWWREKERNQLLSITGHGLLIKEGEGAVGDSKLSTSLAPWVVRLTHWVGGSTLAPRRHSAALRRSDSTQDS